MPSIRRLVFLGLVTFQGVLGAHISHTKNSLINPTGTSNSQPDPLASTYPNNVTGTINQTIIVAPISYLLARQLIPEKYGILPHYAAMLPGFPSKMYPLVLEAKLDHDVQMNGTSIPDFTSFQITFTFVDLLGDGYSTFRYIPTDLITNNSLAIARVGLYGTNAIVVDFDPPNDPYAYVPASQGPAPGAIYFKATSTLGAHVSAKFVPLGTSKGSYLLSFYQNVTNQPTFGDGVVCDNQLRFFNTRITQGVYAPVAIQGNITIPAQYLPKTTTFTNVLGLKLDTAFVENNYLSCASLKGYSYQGE
ncbi:hypothetical protein FRB94_010895 [Tulasnella sp. JGI-2019a]|nr:hypothetical protein FRB93_009722 [Tulasnella sp. JGI-2019a]KAG9010196.1 hypothetical protein FRB94_010895 [Tulasnella sp. JGI-2019a]